MPNSSTPSRKDAARPYLFGAIFVWTLTGAIAWAAFSSRAVPTSPVVANPDLGTIKAPAPSESGENMANLAAQLDAANTTEKPLVASGKTGGIAWEASFEDAMQRARTENKPLMIDFYTDWCGYCKELDRRVFPDKTVVKEAKKWVSIRINAEKRPDVAGAYGVTAYPTIIFAQKSGVPLSNFSGFAPAPEFVSAMKEAHGKLG